MVKYTGIFELFHNYEKLPDVGWLYIDRDFSLESRDDILKKNYYISENMDEYLDMDNSYSAFLESPTLKDIIINKLEHHPNASSEDLLDAVVYCLEEDDFLD